MDEPLSASRLRAARALAELDQKALAELSNVSLSTIARFEAGTGRAQLSPLHGTAIRRALEEAGIVFLLEGEIVGGIALKNGVAQRMKGRRK